MALLLTAAGILATEAGLTSHLWVHVACGVGCAVSLAAAVIVGPRDRSDDGPADVTPVPASAFILGGSTDSSFENIVSNADVFHAGPATRARFVGIRHESGRQQRRSKGAA